MSGSGVGASVGAEQYGKDIITLKTMLSELYENYKIKPLLVAPGGFYEQKWYAQLLEVSGISSIDAVTHHIYNLGGGNYNTLLFSAIAIFHQGLGSLGICILEILKNCHQ